MRMLRPAQLAELLGVSRSTIWRWVSEGRLPKPLKLSRRVTVWRQDDVLRAVQEMARV
ncbi:MAG: AlpA family phage regulatory protein [Bacteroidetes bacterium]|nr:MAG: AlpA family phage regulatory protein [Bacteroidota bacterium]